MSEPDKKIMRMSDLRTRLPLISQHALSCVLQLSKCNDLPTTASRATLQRSRNAACLEAGPYGPLHQRVPVSLTNGKDYFVEMQHPFAMLHKLSATSSTFSAMLVRSLAAHPSTPTKPWRLIMYNDEVTPGPVFVYQIQLAFYRSRRCCN